MTNPVAQFRVRFSVGTKLLLSMTLLLLGSVLTLTFIAIFILTQDKRNAVFTQQSNEAVMHGKDFVGLTKRNIETLKLVLASVDPLKPESWNQKKSLLQNIVNNQTDLAVVRLQKFYPKEQRFEDAFEVSSNEGLALLGINSAELQVSTDLFKELSALAVETGFVASNSTRIGQKPTVAFGVVDTKTPVSENVYLMATGFVAIPYSTTGKANALRIVGRTGWVLFDSDPTRQAQFLNVVNDPLYEKARSVPLASGTLDFKDQDGRYMGSFFKPGYELVVIAKTDWSFAMRSVFELIEKFILIGFLAVGVSILFSMFFSKRLTGPVDLLYDATKKVSEGDFELSLNVRGTDEISALTHSFNVMSKKIGELVEERIKKAHLENELAIASRVQQTLIPPEAITSNYVNIRSAYRAAEMCGGDWWGYFAKENYGCLAIADATGHGLPSALITAAMRSCFSVIEETFMANEQVQYSPAEMISIANKAIYDSSQGQIMMTLFLGIVDFKTGEMTFSSAGHNPPWIFTKGDSGAMERSSLVVRGPRLGEAPEIARVPEKKVQVRSGDVLFMFTDGLTEGKNVTGEMYSKSRLMKAAEETASLGVESLISKLNEEITIHNEGKSLDDDVTMAAIEFSNIGVIS